MTARVVTAASDSDRASSFAYSKAQSKQSAGEGDSSSKFSQMMRDSTSEAKAAPANTNKATHAASRDHSPALQQSKQDKRSQSTQARKATDSPKKDEAEEADSNQGAVATAAQTNDPSPLTMLFGMPTGTVPDGQDAGVEASAAAAAAVEGAPTDSQDKTSSEISSLISARSPLAMLLGMRTAQFGNTQLGNTVVGGQESKPGDGNSNSELSTGEGAGKGSIAATNVNDVASAAPKADGEDVVSSEIDSISQEPLTAFFGKPNAKFDSHVIHGDATIEGKDDAQSKPADDSSSEPLASGGVKKGSITPANINDVASAMLPGDGESKAASETASSKPGLQVDAKLIHGEKAPANLTATAKTEPNDSENSDLSTVTAAAKGSIKPANVNDVAPAAPKSKGERKTSPETDSSTPDRLTLTMPSGMPPPPVDSKAAEGSSNAPSTVKNTSSDASASDLSIGNGTGNKSAAATQANNAASAAQASDSKRKTSSGIDSAAPDRLPLMMPFGTPTPQLDSKMTEESSNASSTVTSTSNDGAASELSTNAATGKESGTAMHANNLAFAMRVSEGELKMSSGVNTSAAAAQSTAGDAPKAVYSPSIAPIVVEASGKSDLDQNSHDTNGSQQRPFVVDPALTRTNTTESAPPASEQSASTATYAGQDVNETVSSEPVKNVRMQLVGEDNKRVDVRLFDRGGELHVSVKSGDLNLTQDLQANMHDLTSRLERQNLQTEVWVPKVAEPTKTESGNTNGFSFDRENRSSSGNSDERRRGRQQQKPEWLESLES